MTDSSPSAATPAEQGGGEYVVVARRYRPQLFEELIGQQHVTRALAGAITSDRVGHAYLFTGARGVGKTSAARILAKALNCVEGTSPTPCNRCEICQCISVGEDIDVLEIDGASNRGIDEIRQLRQNVAVRPSRSRFKVYIIDEVHMLTKEAFNALLKTLEEPPEHVKFIFATTEPNKIPVTILSRCQRYDFAGIDSSAIQTRLQQIAENEGVKIEADALQILAMRAAGSMRDSQSLLEQLLATGSDPIGAEEVTTLLGIAPTARLGKLVQALIDRDAAAALVQLDAAIHHGAEISQLIDQLLGYFRDVMTQAVGCDPSKMLYALPGQRDEVRAAADQLGVHTLLAIVQILDHTTARMRLTTQTRTLAEMAMVRVCHLEDLDELATLVAQLQQSPKSGTGPTAGPGTKKKSVGQGSLSSAYRAASEDKAAKPRPVAMGSSSEEKAQRAVDLPSSADDEVAGSEVAGANRPVEAVSTLVTPLTAENVEEIWKRALDSITGMVADHAAEADEIGLDQQGDLQAGFPENYRLCRDYCERAPNRAQLEEALREICGRPVRLVLTTHDRVDVAEEPPPARVSWRQQQAEVAAQPFVQKALELFDGDPGRLRYVPPKDQA